MLINASITSRKVSTTCCKLEILSIFHIEYEQLIYWVFIYDFWIKRGSSLVIFLYRSFDTTSLKPCEKVIISCLLLVVHIAHQGTITFLRLWCPYNDIPNLNFVVQEMVIYILKRRFTIHSTISVEKRYVNTQLTRVISL